MKRFAATIAMAAAASTVVVLIAAFFGADQFMRGSFSAITTMTVLRLREIP